MPREPIHHSQPTDPEQSQAFHPVVGWHRMQDVQLGVQVSGPEPDTLLDQLYGSQEQQEGVGAVLLWWLQAELPKLLERHPDLAVAAESALECRMLGSTVLGWVEGQRTPQDRDGLWATLSRYQINELIQSLRKARDQAYGRDA